MKLYKNSLQKLGTAILLLLLVACASTKKQVRIVEDFNQNWNFKLGDYPTAIQSNFNTSDWRTLQLPHDWSIEGAFNKDNPTKQAQAFLPAGMGWYRKTFTLPEKWANKTVSIEFDGVFKNSEVFITVIRWEFVRTGTFRLPMICQNICILENRKMSLL